MSTQTSTGTAWAMVVAYPSHGKRYYRFMAGLGDRVDVCRHIPGGACGTPTAEARASEVGRWVRLGRSTSDVLGLIDSWGRKSKPSASNYIPLPVVPAGLGLNPDHQQPPLWG